MNQKITVRTACPDDAEELLHIYAPYIRNTAITFEYEVPTVAEFRSRIRKTLERYPYIVAENNERIVGYAYLSEFKSRAAYDWSVETSIYVDSSLKHCGIGRILYQALEKIAAAMHLLNLNACIAAPEMPDEYLDRNSIDFHAHLGYTLVGEFHKCGYKFGRWYNMVWMEKMIGKHLNDQPEVIPFPTIRDNLDVFGSCDCKE